MNSRSPVSRGGIRLFSAALLLLFAIAVVDAQSAREKRQIEHSIRSVMDRQVAAWNNGDIAGFMEGYWRSPKLLFVSGDKVTRGWQTTLDRYKRSYDSRAKMGTLTFSDLEVNVLSSDLAVVLGSWSLERGTDRPHGKFTLTFRKLKLGWRIIIDHTS